MTLSPVSRSRLGKFHAILALAAVSMLALAPGEVSAAPRFCPQFITKYCVMNSAGLIFTAFTNPCFAARQHLRVLYIGSCKFGPVTPRTCKGTTCV